MYNPPVNPILVAPVPLRIVNNYEYEVLAITLTCILSKTNRRVVSVQLFIVLNYQAILFKCLLVHIIETPFCVSRKPRIFVYMIHFRSIK